MFFALLFIAALGFWSLVYRLPMQKASLLSSCVMSSVHGTIVSVVGFKLLREWKSFDLDIENTREQTLLVEFSFAYMIADFFFYLIPFTPNDVMFIVHHFISTLFIVGVLLYNHTAIGCILMFWMGEVTSPLLNVFTFSRELRHTSKVAFRVFQISSPLFTVCYILVRSILAPPMVAWFVYSIWFRCTAIPLAWRVPMGSCVALGIVGSQVWTMKLVRGFVRQRRKAQSKRE